MPIMLETSITSDPPEGTLLPCFSTPHSQHVLLLMAGPALEGCLTCGEGFWRRISSVRHAPWIWLLMQSRHSSFSYGLSLLLCRRSISVLMRAYFFSSDCLMACSLTAFQTPGWEYGVALHLRSSVQSWWCLWFPDQGVLTQVGLLIKNIDKIQ